SLNTPLEEETGQTYMDVIPATDTVEDKIADTQFREILSEKISEFTRTLKGKEAFILKYRLMAEEPLTLQAAGEQLQISRERARQIEKKVVDKLRIYLKEQLPDLEGMQVLLEKRAEEESAEA
ncbi:MAG TPA: sigma factor-like helix-turn-helix DNA-binding protein, partial [Thermodesulfobacteriota bacterium]|nr:sigma factor-like helix-turn-helix DNA-binding protein [Thermodesulfobacteriota bacterium]